MRGVRLGWLEKLGIGETGHLFMCLQLGISFVCGISSCVASRHLVMCCISAALDVLHHALTQCCHVMTVYNALTQCSMP